MRAAAAGGSPLGDVATADRASAVTPCSLGDTIAAIATAPGRGAIAIVRVSGPATRRIAEHVCPGRSPRPRVAELRRIVAPDGALIDRGIALLFEAPLSYTGEDVLELHVHGSSAVARETLLAALHAGARMAEPGEFTRRAFEAGKLDLTAAEAVAELIAAEHRSEVRAAAARVAGGLAAEVERLQSVLSGVLAELSAALDFPDEVPSPSPDALTHRLQEAADSIDALSRTWERGRLVREGAAVVIVGPPNAGKSSLFNGLLGSDRAIVSDVPGTTRDTVEEQVALGEGLVARLVDTAGLRCGAIALEAAGIARSRAALDHARLALVVVDASRHPDDQTDEILRATRGRPRVVYYNKRDVGTAAYERRQFPEEADALLGSAYAATDVAAVRDAVAKELAGDRIDLARPHLGTARQADAVLAARSALAAALETLRAHEPIDLIASDLLNAQAALRGLSGRDASEAVLSEVFARFCIGK